MVPTLRTPKQTEALQEEAIQGPSTQAQPVEDQPAPERSGGRSNEPGPDFEVTDVREQTKAMTTPARASIVVDTPPECQETEEEAASSTPPPSPTKTGKKRA